MINHNILFKSASFIYQTFTLAVLLLSAWKSSEYAMFQANSLQKNVDAWSNIAANEQVCLWLKEGIKIPFIDTPPSFALANHSLNKTQEKFIDAEIEKLIVAGAIEEVTYTPHCISPIGSVPKKNGKQRIILNLKVVNGYLSK